jgi:hypothetical protein
VAQGRDRLHFSALGELHSREVVNNNNNHGSTVLYGLRPPLSEVNGSCVFVAVGDWTTGRAAVLSILM